MIKYTQRDLDLAQLIASRSRIEWRGPDDAVVETDDTFVAALIRAYVSKCLSQAREQEREAAKGLVEALELAETEMRYADWNSILADNVGRAYLAVTDALATYREKSGEKV